MKFIVMTLFPELVASGLSGSIIGKALADKKIEIEYVNIRDYTTNKHLKVDDYPFGGGAGMVMQVQPILDAYKTAVAPINSSGRVLYMSPQGKTFNQDMAFSFAKEASLVLLCGHYEGIDERVIESIVTDEISIGDYVLTGGEMAAMVLIDAIGRLVPGVLNNEISAETETFYEGLIEYPQYSRPAVYEDMKVPDVLLSGNHKKVDEWRREQSLIRTILKRPDLLQHAKLSEKDKIFINNYCTSNGIVL